MMRATATATTCWVKTVTITYITSYVIPKASECGRYFKKTQKCTCAWSLLTHGSWQSNPRLGTSYLCVHRIRRNRQICECTRMWWTEMCMRLLKFVHRTCTLSYRSIEDPTGGTQHHHKHMSPRQLTCVILETCLTSSKNFVYDLSLWRFVIFFFISQDDCERRVCWWCMYLIRYQYEHLRHR
jgi:hypothetical protein